MRGGGPPGRGPLRLGCGGGEAKVPPPPPPVPPLLGAPPVMPAHSLPVLRACLQMTHMQPSLRHMHEGSGQQACHTVSLTDWRQTDQMAECPPLDTLVRVLKLEQKLQRPSTGAP